MKIETRLRWRGTAVRAAERAALIDGLGDAAQHLLGEAQTLVPHETGDLESSGRAGVDESGPTGWVSFDTVYAVRQHEELTWRHDPGRQAKYLEEPLYRESSTMADLIAASLRRALR